MTYLDWLLVAPVMAVFGGAFYLLLTNLVPAREPRHPFAWGVTMFAIASLIDLFFVLPRVMTLTWLQLPTSVAVVLEGFMCWLAFAGGMGGAAFAVEARRGR